jgi:tetratricopeptide (TPR) repeat protein/TolB-like protein
LTKDGRVKILDFGVAHLRSGPRKKANPTAVTDTLTDSNTVVGTLSYMSPEQVRGREVTAQSDIFAFGCVLYEMICRKQAFPGGNAPETVAAILEDDPQPVAELVPSVPFALEQIVSRCLEKHPADRFESARDVAFAIRGAAETLRSGSSTQPTPAARGWRSRRMARWAFATALLAAAVGVVHLVTMPGAIPLPEEKHLAVIDFASPADDASFQQFAAGLSETVADGLGLLEEQTLGKLWVAPANTQSDAHEDPIGTLRREYNINLAVNGRLERQDNRVTLDISLVDPQNRKVLRSTTIEDELGNLSSFQTVPLERMAQMLDIELTSQTRGRLAASTTKVTAAFEACVKARGLLHESDPPKGLDSAIVLLQAAVADDPLYQPAGERLASAYLLKFEDTRQAKWLQKAREQIGTVIDQRPTPHAYRTLASIHHAAGEYDSEVAALEQATTLAPGCAALFTDLADAYQALGKYEEARRAHQQAINRRVGYWRGYYDFALFCYTCGEDDEAANAFRQAIHAAPENFKSYNALGGVLFKLGQLDEARELFEQSIQIEPVDNYSAPSNLGTLYYFEARFADAVRMYQRALEHDDGDYVVWGNLGFAQTYAGDLEGAQRSFQRAIKMAETLLGEEGPETVELPSDLASYHAMIGDRDSARRFQETAVARLPIDSEVPVTLIETFEIMGDRELALEWVGKALARGMDTDELDKDPTLRGLVADERYRRLVDRSQGGVAEPGGGVPAGS